MSTPSTITAIHPPNPLHNRTHLPNYQHSASNYRPSHLAPNGTSKLYSSYYNSPHSPAESHQPESSRRKRSYHASVAHQTHSPAMESPGQQSRKANWTEFYKNGLPKEVIVIDDSSPEASAKVQRPSESQRRNAQHADKRRKTDASTVYDPIYAHRSRNRALQNEESTSNSTTSSGRTTSALYPSTAPTSMTSQGSGGHRVQKLDDTRAGQKRKRPSRRAADEESPELEVITQNYSWSHYHPPPKPPIKAKEVYVEVLRDKTSSSSSKIDDEDGHFIVNTEAELTDRYRIIKLLGQGTFGKVVEAYDKVNRSRCAVKIIRAVQKYRDASRIELRVLATLASNDKHNRNRCIHLRDCFDYRNHICIVTDLLGMSVFDFLKTNSFTPFPCTHIQSFARQLFTSVAFLHDLNLIHTDLKPENILLVNNSYQTFTYNGPIPSSTRANPRSAKYRRVLLDPEIRLIDFGSATFNDEYHSSVVSTRHYRAPEIILNLGWSYPCDIWSIGCILVEFYTGDALFQTHDNLEHLAMMEAVCDTKIDKETILKVRANSKGSGGKSTAANFFLPRAYRLDYPNSDTPRTSRKYVKNMRSLEETLQLNSHFNRQFLDLLKKIFVYEPSKRITAKQALNHPWFRETLQDDGTEALRIRLQKEAREREAREQERDAQEGHARSSAYR